MKVSKENQQKIRKIILLFIFAIGFISYLFLQDEAAYAQTLDPLPSWNQGTAKTSIIEFVNRVTKEDSADFVPKNDRIAIFDNDGTLWVEKPFIQMMFVKERLKMMVKTDPSLKEKQPFKAALEDDDKYFQTHKRETAMMLLGSVYANMTQKQFETEIKAFFAQAIHPQLNLPYTKVGYQPMIELMEYLRNNDFQTWIGSGGGSDIIRAISQEMYGVPPQQIIGSSTVKEFIEKDDKAVIWRKSELNIFNDQFMKPVNIELFIGKQPIFAAGNVGSEGDIPMLTYSQAQKNPTFQLLVNHDDAQREFVYSESSNGSLNAAEKNGWQVVSMKNDWKTLFNRKAEN